MVDKILRTDFGYELRYTHTIMSGPVLRWGDKFEVSASREGVMIQGYSDTLEVGDLPNLLKLIALAGHVHIELKHGKDVKDIDFSVVN